MSIPAFSGFPGIGRATAIPNLFFETVLPTLASPAAVLAFLWVARLVQERDADARCVSAADVWASAAARRTFENIAGGRPGLETGLEQCVASGALLALESTRTGAAETLFYVNNPPSRRSLARMRSGQAALGAVTAPAEPDRPARPHLFRLYEDHIGTITPLVADRLTEIAEAHPAEWIEDAFREAALRGVRNLRYVERILENRVQEGRASEGTATDSLADRKRRYGDSRLRPGRRPG